MQSMVVPIWLVGILSILGSKAVAVLGLGMVVGLGTVVYRGSSIPIVVSVPTFRMKRLWGWLNEEDAAMMDALEDIMQALMYLGLVTIVFMFFGFMASTFLVAMNITDPNSLPVFGTVIGKLVDAMGTGASLVIVAFMMVLMIPMVVLFIRIGRSTSTAVRTRD